MTECRAGEDSTIIPSVKTANECIDHIAEALSRLRLALAFAVDDERFMPNNEPRIEKTIDFLLFAQALLEEVKLKEQIACKG